VGPLTTSLHSQGAKYSASALSLFLVCCLSVASSDGAIDAVSLFKKASPSVITLVALDPDGHALQQGSGFVAEGGTVIITNYHVIAGAEAVKARTSTGRVFRVTTALRVDEKSDLAILRLEGQADLVPLSLGDSSNVRIGEEVVTIGSPQGLENSVSTGIVSGLRVFNDNTSYLQTTAPISPGSSGGPLLNARGEVVGVTTFLVRGGQNLNFCVPINYARAMLERPKPSSLSALVPNRQKSVSDILGLWTYDTICDSCKPKRASGTIFIKEAHGELVINGHIVYTDGSEFTWIERAYTDGSTIWAYGVNDRGDVGIHVYNLEDERMRSSWIMSNGAAGTAASEKVSETAP
jgi:hypothetical protein